MDAAWQAVKHAKFPRVHIFIATSQIHMEYKLKMTPDEVRAATVDAHMNSRPWLSVLLG